MVYTVTAPANALERSELAVSLAVLILADSGKDVTKENIDSITAAAGINDLNPVFAAAFSAAAGKQDLSKLLAGPTPGAGAAPSAASSSAASSSAPVEAAPEEEKKKQESDADVGAGGLFGDDGGDDY